MLALTKLATVHDHVTIIRYDNGWMVEVSGRDKKEEWATTKTVCNTEAEVIELLEEYNSLPVDN